MPARRRLVTHLEGLGKVRTSVPFWGLKKVSVSVADLYSLVLDCADDEQALELLNSMARCKVGDDCLNTSLGQSWLDPLLSFNDSESRKRALFMSFSRICFNSQNTTTGHNEIVSRGALCVFHKSLVPLCPSPCSKPLQIFKTTALLMTRDHARRTRPSPCDTLLSSQDAPHSLLFSASRL